MEGANIPFDVFMMIMHFLPDSVLYALWCTGRELHSQTRLYNERILPCVRLAQWHKLCAWRHAVRARGEFAHVAVRDGAFLESMSPFQLRFDTFDGISGNLSGTLLRPRAVYSFLPLILMHIRPDYFADASFEFDLDNPIRLVIYYADNIERFEEFAISRIVYLRWANRIEVVATRCKAGYLNKAGCCSRCCARGTRRRRRRRRVVIKITDFRSGKK